MLKRRIVEKCSMALLLAGVYAGHIQGEQAKEASMVQTALEPFVEDQTIAGAVTLVVNKNGVVAIDEIGSADLASGREMKEDTLFWIASMTKPMTGVAVMMLVDEGKVDIEQPVETYLPEFKGQMLVDKEKEPREPHAPQRLMKVRDLLTHTSGLVSSVPPRATLEEAVKAYAAAPLQSEPGSKWSYNNPGINTLGRIVEVVSGMPYEQFMQERLFDPLEMRDTTFWPSEAQAQRLAVSYAKNEASGKLEPTTIKFLNDLPPTERNRMPSPAGGLFSTAQDLAKIYQMLLNEGSLNGKVYLKKNTLEKMITNQTRDLKVSFTPGMHMGLGFHLVNEPQGVTAMLSKGSYGHGGAYGTQSWMDLQRGLGLVLLIQRAGLPNADGSPIREAFQKAAIESFVGR